MGSDDASLSYTNPPHRVGFTYDFWMDTTEVTQQSYEQLVGVTPWKDYHGNHPGGTSADRPAWYLNWYDAVYYCNARSKRDGFDTVYSYTAIKMGGDDPDKWQIGKDHELVNLTIHYDRYGYRLPTEAEWEYACRGGTTSMFYWPDDADPRDFARFDEDDTDPGTLPVASLLPNAYGLYDMSGNVSEWCNDWLAPYPGDEMRVDPHGADTTGTSIAPDGWLRVVRGGGWRYCEQTVASYVRGGNVPHNRNYRSQTQVPCMENEGSDDRFGFRCVLEVR
jgi:formylglycine-generating enzyme required for sulfatase activity